MSRLPRIHLEGVLYVVTSRGDSPAPLFKDQHDYEAYLRLVREYKARYECKLFAYCLLADHLLLCLEPAPGTTISAIMHDLTTRYTKYYNKRHGRTGHLFHERFKAVIVAKESLLLPVTAHLHTYPVWLGLAKDAKGYPLSSYGRYLSTDVSCEGPEMSAEIHEVLNALPADHTEADYERYVQSLSDVDLANLRAAFQHRIAGSEEFVRMVKERLARPRPVHVQTAHAAATSRLPAGGMRLLIGNLTAVVVVLLVMLYQRVQTLEQMLVVLSQENEAAFRARSSFAIHSDVLNELGSLGGTSWELQLLMPIEVQAAQHQVNAFLVEFTRTQVSLNTPVSPAPLWSDYTLTLTPQANGTVAWEARQTTPQGEVFRWRGEWRGTRMRGLLTHHAVGKTPVQVAFVGSPRKPAGMRSEI